MAIYGLLDKWYASKAPTIPKQYQQNLVLFYIGQVDLCNSSTNSKETGLSHFFGG